MSVLIVESNAELGGLWMRCLQRLGCEVALCQSQAQAIEHLCTRSVRVIVLNLLLENGGALAISDYASFRHPDARIVFVTRSGFFSDGSIFQHAANACAILPADTMPEDLAAVVDYHRGIIRDHAAHPSR